MEQIRKSAPTMKKWLTNRILASHKRLAQATIKAPIATILRKSRKSRKKIRRNIKIRKTRNQNQAIRISIRTKKINTRKEVINPKNPKNQIRRKRQMKRCPMVRKRKVRKAKALKVRDRKPCKRESPLRKKFKTPDLN